MPNSQHFIVVAPPYMHNSFGVRVLHQLCHTMNNLGFPTTMMFVKREPSGQNVVGFGTKDHVNPKLNTPPQPKCPVSFFESAVVIYPESIDTNPLQAKRVVRYYLNKETYFPGDKKIQIGAKDFIVAFHRIFYPDAHCVLTQVGFNPAFHAEGARPLNERTLKLTYIGKGEFDGPVSIIKDTVLVARNWPTTQDQLAILLRNSSLVFTWDPITSLVTESVLCGAMPVILRYGKWKDAAEDYSTELGYVPRLDMNSKNFEVDLVKYNEDRNKLLGRIKYLETSWDERVKKTVLQALAHFG